jgi:hypothetical protein
MWDMFVPICKGPLAFVEYFNEPPITHVAVWELLHWNRQFAKTHHKRLWKRNPTNNLMTFPRQKQDTKY